MSKFATAMMALPVILVFGIALCVAAKKIFQVSDALDGARQERKIFLNFIGVCVGAFGACLAFAAIFGAAIFGAVEYWAPLI